MVSAILESKDIGYLIFVIVSIVLFIAFVKFFPEDKNFKSKTEAEEE